MIVSWSMMGELFTRILDDRKGQNKMNIMEGLSIVGLILSLGLGFILVLALSVKGSNYE